MSQLEPPILLRAMSYYLKKVAVESNLRKDGMKKGRHQCLTFLLCPCGACKRILSCWDPNILMFQRPESFDPL
eukprot:4928442-Ditylum_brightwellii.AAC.1